MTQGLDEDSCCGMGTATAIGRRLVHLYPSQSAELPLNMLEVSLPLPLTMSKFVCIRQLGVGDTSSRGTVPSDMGYGLDFVDLGTGRSATNVGCGQHHSCAVLDDGSLKCWGWNSKGM